VDRDVQPGFLPGFFFVADVDLGSGIVADEEDVERRRAASAGGEGLNLRRQLLPMAPPRRDAVECLRGHPA
jgi:hypothetical protein